MDQLVFIAGLKSVQKHNRPAEQAAFLLIFICSLNKLVKCRK